MPRLPRKKRNTSSATERISSAGARVRGHRLFSDYFKSSKNQHRLRNDSSDLGTASQAQGVGLSQVRVNLRGVLIPKIAIFFQALTDDPFQFGRDIGIEAGRKSRCAVQDRVENYPARFSLALATLGNSSESRTGAGQVGFIAICG